MKNPILYALRCCTLLSFLFSFLLNAQTKNVASSKNNKNIQNPADIYVAGNYAIQGQFFGPAYTKNGERTPLTQTEYGLAKAIQVVGHDVYVAGDIKDKAVYWKNGQAHYLTCSDPNSTATCIAVVGNDVYVGGNGSTNGDNVYPRYWKNGQEIVLPRHIFLGREAATYVTNIAVVDNDAYVIGTAVYEPVYWKNGQKVNAINNDLQRVVAIKELNGDVYAIGAKDKRAAYWKNGQTKVLSSEESMATAIAIDGNDVYVAGILGGYENKNMYPGYGNGGTGYLWKNGVQQKLENDVYPFSIAVSAGDIYITGMDQRYASYRLLKNGQRIESAVDPMYVVSARNGNGSKNISSNGNENVNKKVEGDELTKESNVESGINVQPKKTLTPEEETELFFRENKKKAGVLTTDSGLQLEVLKEGKGSGPKRSDKVKVLVSKTMMVGKEIKGTTVSEAPSIMEVGVLIPGMAEGLTYMNVGSKIRIYVPPSLAYGAKAPSLSFIFELELLEIIK